MRHQKHPKRFCFKTKKKFNFGNSLLGIVMNISCWKLTYQCHPWERHHPESHNSIHNLCTRMDYSRWCIWSYFRGRLRPSSHDDARQRPVVHGSPTFFLSCSQTTLEGQKSNTTKNTKKTWTNKKQLEFCGKFSQKIEAKIIMSWCGIRKGCLGRNVAIFSF